MYHVINIVMLILHIHMVSGTGIAGVCIIKEKAKNSALSLLSLFKRNISCVTMFGIFPSMAEKARNKQQSFSVPDGTK